MASSLDIDLGCSAAVLCRRLKALRRRRYGDSHENGSEDVVDYRDDDVRNEARSFTVSCRMTTITASSRHSSSSSSRSSSSASTSSSRDSNRRSVSSRRGNSQRRRHSSRVRSIAKRGGYESPTAAISFNQHQHQYQIQHQYQHQQQHQYQHQQQHQYQHQQQHCSPTVNRSNNDVPRKPSQTGSIKSPAPDWTDRLLLVLQPTAEDPNKQRRQTQFDVQRVRQIFCVLFRLDLLAKLLANLPTLKAIVNKTRCCVKLRDALLFKRLPRTGCMVKYMMFSFESDAKHQVDACLRFLEEFDSAFALRKPWRSRNGCATLVLRWNKRVPENTLLSMYGQRLMRTSRLFCCSPIGPNTGWVRPLAAQAAGTPVEGGVPEGLLG